MLPGTARPNQQRLSHRLKLFVAAGLAALALLSSLAAVSAGMAHRTAVDDGTAAQAWHEYRQGERAPLAAPVDTTAAFRAYQNYRQGERAPLIVPNR